MKMKLMTSLVLAAICMSTSAFGASEACEKNIRDAALTQAKSEAPGMKSEISIDRNFSQNPSLLDSSQGIDTWVVRLNLRDCHAQYTVKTTTGDCVVQPGTSQSSFGDCS